MKKGRGLAGFYNCAHCPFVTRICAELWRHARHHLANAKGFNCSLCSFSSISLEVMEEHQLLHPEGAAFIRQNLVDDEDPASTPVTPNCVELKCDTGSELCLEDHMVVHSEPGSGVDTGAAPSPSASAEIAQKSSSEKSESPDSQKAQGMFDSSKEGDGTAPSSADVTSNSSDLKMPLSIKIDNALRIMRPTKEVLPVLKRGRNNEDCPFVESDEMIFNMHREMHGGRTRAFACNLCNYSCFAAEALHWHLSLHLPPLSPASAVLQRRRGFGRRSFQTSDPIPLGAKHFSCTQCSFRTVNEATFVQHRQQHAQHIQQRLVTQMKRAATEEESRKSSKMKRVAKKSDKMHSCVRCAFRCDTTVAYSRHLEMHTQNALFKCRICDYSANTKKIVDFHEQNHHLDQSITQLRRNAILAPDIVQVSATDDERARIAGQEFRCKRCNFHTLEISTLAKHFEQHHGETEADREIAADLRMNLVPANSILTTA
ncbi:zinc finger, C2H2 type [Necator americanus]|uniref:Zinc finger, C2H2 type n=1 Tax=Necator americanus TaxID=51031 RepID=W2SP11_NECAM|nr:zinc finger, C2H2 type [Necator americanus]ETN70611.1 zinc finger, C2H2 type [Necator americanus]